MKISTMTKSVVAPLCMAILLPLTAAAAPPVASSLPENAKWVIHLDLQAITGTAVVDEARQEQPQLADLVRGWMEATFGVTPQEDLDSLTMFSDSYEEHTGAMILRANYDPKKVTSALAERPGVRQQTWQGYTVFTVTEQQQSDALLPPEGEPRQQMRPLSIVLVDADTIVVGSSPQQAQQAVALVAGQARTLPEDSPLMSELKQGAIVYGAAINLNQLEQREGIFPILTQHERIYWTVRETNGEVVANLTLHAQSEEVAEQMKTTLEGSVAFGEVWAGESENLKKLMQNREVRRDGRVVQLVGRSDSQTVVNAMREIADRLQQRVQPQTAAN